MRTLLLLILSGLVARSAQLEWDAVPAVTITNYAVHIGPASGVYTGRVNVGAALLYRFTNAPASVTWYRLTAQTTHGVESDPSNELAFTNRAFAPVIRLNLSSAASPEGPWNDETNSPPLTVVVTGPQRFYRARVEITAP